MANRKKLLFGAGLAVFLIGGLMTALSVTRSSGGQGAKNQAPALYATTLIPAGTTGATAVNQGLVKVRTVAATALPPGALTDVSQLAGTITAAPVPQGKVLVSEDFPPAKTRLGSLRIPEGKTALALQLKNVAGLAGFAAAGDRVNIYGVSRESAPSSTAGPSVHLIMQQVEVLNVNGAAVVAVQGKPDGADLVYLLAVTPADGERLIYLASFQQLYFSLVPQGQIPVGSTPGAGPVDSLRLA